jgi:hypothetical protein
MSPQNHQKCDLMFTLPKSDILHFNQSQVQNRHKGHRTVAALYTPLGDVEEIFNPLGVSLGASES